MEYDFTTVLDRAGHDCTAADIIPFRDFTVDEGFSVIPMWVADMSFPVAPPILKAVQDRLSFPFLGYFHRYYLWCRSCPDCLRFVLCSHNCSCRV